MTSSISPEDPLPTNKSKRRITEDEECDFGEDARASEPNIADSQPIEDTMYMWKWICSFPDHDRWTSATLFRRHWGVPRVLCKKEPTLRFLFDATSLVIGPNVELVMNWLVSMIQASRAFTFREIIALSQTSRHFRWACLSPRVWLCLAQRDFYMKFLPYDVMTPHRYYALACARLRAAKEMLKWFVEDERFRICQSSTPDLDRYGLDLTEVNISLESCSNEITYPFKCLHRASNDHVDELWLSNSGVTPVVKFNFIKPVAVP